MLQWSSRVSQSSGAPSAIQMTTASAMAMQAVTHPRPSTRLAAVPDFIRKAACHAANVIAAATPIAVHRMGIWWRIRASA